MAREKRRYVVCLNNDGYPASLERRKIYVALGKDEEGFMRVIDESGEDYMYPIELFAEIELPTRVARALSASG